MRPCQPPGGGRSSRIRDLACPLLVNAAHRASVAFILDLIGIARDGRRPLDALLLSAIVQANVAPISSRADAQVGYAIPEAPPPDELRRPVSINALASSLRLPFESVRRRVLGLAHSGLCRISPEGLIVSLSGERGPHERTRLKLSTAWSALRQQRTFTSR